jgi:broad specificity phosphatase PhoE
MKTELLFVRHGQTNSNILGLLHGRTDVPLTPLGHRQAEMVARRLSQFGDLSYLYSSPLRRARSTAEQIAMRTGLSLHLIDELAEFDFGDLEGYTYEQIQEYFPELYAKLLDPSTRDLPFPNGESPKQFHERVGTIVYELARSHRGERIVVVAHGGVIGSSIATLTGGSLDDNMRYSVRNCSVTHIELAGLRMSAIHCLDDVEHLLELEDQEVIP